jgi:hypothetical protein
MKEQLQIAVNSNAPDPRSLDNETLAKYVAGIAGSIAAQFEGLQPYYLELRGRFHHIKKNETILGCKIWDEYCDRVLNRTRRAVNYWLAGGNPASKRLPAAPERETVSRLPAALENAVDQLTSHHVLTGHSICRWCKQSSLSEDCEHPCECSLLVEPSTHDGEFFWIMILEVDSLGGCGLAGNKKALAKCGVGLFIHHAMSKAHNLPERMVYEVRELPPSIERKNYNQWLYTSHEQWFELEVLGHAPAAF